MKKIKDVLITALLATFFILVFLLLFSQTRYRLRAYLKEYYYENITKLSYHNGERLRGESGKYIGPRVDYIFQANEDDTLVVYKLNKKYGYINIVTEQIDIDSKKHSFDYAWSFDHQSGLAAVVSDGKIGFIRKNGSFQMHPQYPYKKRREDNFSCEFKDGFCIIPSENGRKYGLIDDANILVLPIIYDAIGDLQHGLRVVGKDGKFGLLDSTFTIVLDIVYNDITINKLGVVVLDANKNSQQLLGFDLTTVLSKYVFDEISSITIEDLSLDDESDDEWNQTHPDFSTFNINGNVGLLNKEGIVMIEATWDNIEYFGGDIFKALLDEKYFLIGSNGKFIH
jgi:hypothetical protein